MSSRGRQPKVLQVVDSLYPGGAERVVLMLAELLHDRGIGVTVLSLYGEPERSIGPELARVGAEVVCIPPTSLHGLIDARRFLRVLTFMRRGGFDLAQTHLFYANSIGCVAARLCRIPAIATLHGTGHAPRRGNGAKVRLEGLVLRRIATSVAAVGEAVAATHVGKTRPGALAVLPNPVSAAPAALTADERHALRQDICGDATRPLLFCAGRLSVEKGTDDLVRAFAIVQRKNPAVVLALAGIGELHADLCRLITDLGLEGSVHLLGWRDDVPRLLAAADLYVSASLWEGAPLAILEAAAAGLPIVATSTGENPLVLGNGRGILVPPGDVTLMSTAICKALDDPEAARRSGDAARRFVIDHHAVEEWGRRVLALYASVAPALRQWGPDTGQEPVAPQCAG